jgi:hypothetical protein
MTNCFFRSAGYKETERNGEFWKRVGDDFENGLLGLFGTTFVEAIKDDYLRGLGID